MLKNYFQWTAVHIGGLVLYKGGTLLLALPLKFQSVNSQVGHSNVLGPWFITPTAKNAIMTPSSATGPPSA